MKLKKTKQIHALNKKTNTHQRPYRRDRAHLPSRVAPLSRHDSACRTRRVLAAALRTWSRQIWRAWPWSCRFSLETTCPTWDCERRWVWCPCDSLRGSRRFVPCSPGRWSPSWSRIRPCSPGMPRDRLCYSPTSSNTSNIDELNGILSFLKFLI